MIIDPERGPIVVWAFETYATGLYSLPTSRCCWRRAVCARAELAAAARGR